MNLKATTIPVRVKYPNRTRTLLFRRLIAQTVCAQLSFLSTEVAGCAKKDRFYGYT